MGRMEAMLNGMGVSSIVWFVAGTWDTIAPDSPRSFLVAVIVVGFVGGDGRRDGTAKAPVGPDTDGNIGWEEEMIESGRFIVVAPWVALVWPDTQPHGP